VAKEKEALIGGNAIVTRINKLTHLEWQWSAIKAPSFQAVRRANGGRPIWAERMASRGDGI
jgi:hypothetical protein